MFCVFLNQESTLVLKLDFVSPFSSHPCSVLGRNRCDIPRVLGGKHQARSTTLTLSVTYTHPSLGTIRYGAKPSRPPRHTIPETVTPSNSLYFFITSTITPLPFARSSELPEESSCEGSEASDEVSAESRDEDGESGVRRSITSIHDVIRVTRCHALSGRQKDSHSA